MPDGSTRHHSRRPRTRWRAVASITALAFFVVSANARGLQAQEQPDIVRLKNGGMMRGTLIEAVPGQVVRIKLIDGTIREIPPDLVAFAGSVRDDRAAAASGPAPTPAPTVVAPAPTPPPVLRSDRIRLRLMSPNQGATFAIETATTSFAGTGVALANGQAVPAAIGGQAGHYERLCTAPCERTIDAGTHRFDLTLVDGRSAKSDRINMPIDGTLVGNYQSRAALRTAGLLLLILGTVGALAMVLHVKEDPDCAGSPGCGTTSPLALPGFLLLGVSVGGGSLMMWTPDKANLRYVPDRR